MPSYQFTYNQEIGHQGQSLVPHFPGGQSGVTIGPGYDMGWRSPGEIYRDLTSAGVSPETAHEFMKSAYLRGEEAAEWSKSNVHLTITEEQQQNLFEEVLVPEYEQRTIDQLQEFMHTHPDEGSATLEWEHLSDMQKQILFDYAYNPGLAEFPKLTQAVLEEDWKTVELEYERYVGGEQLSYRNESFFNEFLGPDSQRWSTNDELPERTQPLDPLLLLSSELPGERQSEPTIEELLFSTDFNEDEKPDDNSDWYDA